MEARVEKLISGGAGFARRDDGLPIFIEGALPGELVEYDVDAVHRTYLHAQVKRILHASSDRVEPACPLYGRCGGCNLQHLASNRQADAKASLAYANLVRIGHVDMASVSVAPVASGPGWGYRNRVRFHVDMATGAIGFLGRKSDELVPVSHCPILCDELNDALKERKAILAAARKAMFANRKGKGGYLEVSAFAGDHAVSFGDEAVSVTVGKRFYAVSASVFFQANRFLLPDLVSHVVSHVEGTSIMDLYSGVGLFAAAIADTGRTVVAVERQRSCLALAARNVGPSVTWYAEAVENWGKNERTSVDTVVVDPPRTGLAPEVPGYLARWNPEAIVYVSCNGVTLARDLQRLAEQGYTCRALRVFDLYPQTAHHEVVAALKR